MLMELAENCIHHVDRFPFLQLFFFFKSNEFLGHLGNEWLRKEGQSQAFWRTRDLGTVSELVDQTVVLAHQPHPFLDLSPGPRPVEEE